MRLKVTSRLIGTPGIVLFKKNANKGMVTEWQKNKTRRVESTYGTFRLEETLNEVIYDEYNCRVGDDDQ